MPDFEIEKSYAHKIVAGTDEAGRGPLCGPVVAAAVIINNPDSLLPDLIALKINDSKKMTAARRAAAYEYITNNPNIIWACAECSPTEIDELNILHASMLAMRRSIDNLPTRPDFVLVDGNRMPPDITGRPIVRGDAKSMSIACASIIAKVTRDKIMQDLSAQFPEYGWDKNAGYPTASHLNAIKIHGINEHYRKSFGPVKRLL